MDNAKVKLTIAVDTAGGEQEIRRINAALDNLGKSSQNAGSAADRLSSALGRVGHYAAGGAGIYAIANSAMAAGKAMFEASTAADRLRTQLSFSVGNTAREFGYLTGLADRMGLEFRSTAQAYSGFAAAARGTAMEGQKTRDVFEAIAKASAVMGLSSDQSAGALLAIQQMMSKGVVSAEEFRGQLGERMPMALQAGAKALGVTTAEFSKMMESGKIVSEDFLPKFAAAITEMLGDAPEKAANRLDAATNRMANAWDRLKRTVGDSGISKAIANDMNTLTSVATVTAESMEQSARRGEGSFMQLATAAGALIGRSALGGLASTAEMVNGAINLLTGGVLGLSTNISLLPDNLKPVAEQLLSVESKLKTAQAEYEALSARVAKAPDNIYIRSELAQLDRYIEKLKDTRRELALMTDQPLSENYGNEGRGATQKSQADEAALAAARSRAQAYAAVFEKYATPSERLSKALREAKASLGEFFTPEVERRIRDSIKISPGKTEKSTASDNEATAAAKSYAQAMEQLAKASKDAEAAQLGLTGVSRQWHEFISTAEFQNMPQTWKDTALAQYEAASAAESAAEQAKRLRELLAPTESSLAQSLANDIEILDRALANYQITAEQYFEAIEKRTDSGSQKIKEQGSLAKDLGLTFTSAFENAVVSGGRFSDVLKGIEQDIIRLMLRMTVTEPLTNLIGGINWGGIFGGATGGSSTPGFSSGTLGSGLRLNALGDVYSSPSLSAYSGGVYDKPQLFAFAKGAGVFGEAGPEAIMPLKRGRDGKLGVASEGGGAGVIVNVINKTDGEARTERRTDDRGQSIIDVIVERAKGAIAADIARGSGPVPSAMQGTYGLSRTAGAY